MKTLWLARHAKSSKKDDGRADHDRPLNKRGKREAPRLGAFLRERRLVPDLIVSSTAKRARKTAAKIAKASGYEGVIEVTGALYLAPPSQYIEVLRSLPDHIERVMVVGHNPGAEAFLAQLTGHSLPLPTATVAHLELDIDAWRQITETSRGRLVDVHRAKELK